MKDTLSLGLKSKKKAGAKDIPVIRLLDDIVYDFHVASDAHEKTQRR